MATPTTKGHKVWSNPLEVGRWVGSYRAGRVPCLTGKVRTWVQKAEHLLARLPRD